MRKCLAIFLFILLTFMVTSCASKAKSTSNQSTRAVSAIVSGGLTQASSGADSALTASITTGGLESEASRLHSTTGRVALAMIIHKLDNTQSVESLAAKSASDLFSSIEILAPQKSQTLEALDRLYALRQILASEKIYVQIQANDVSSTAPFSDSADWEQKFESAIKSGA